MGLTDNPALWFLPFASIISVWVAWSDMATMKIPNKAVIALLAVFIVIGALALPFDTYLPRLAQFFVVLVITFILSMVGLIGAGDAKFAAAMAPFVALVDVPLILVLFAICLLFGFISHRGARLVPQIKKSTEHWESWSRMKQFPMGYPLALTLVVYLALSAF